MKRSRLGISVLMLALGHLNAQGQTSPMRLHSSMGLATYFGDLKEKAKIIDQSSFTFNLGATYDINDQTLARFDFSIQTLKADDKYNKRSDLIARNLNFQSTVWEFNVSMEYDFLNTINDDYFLSPYVYLGLGIMHMNPWTYDRTGVKRYLRQYNTEGQGLPSYPERKPYSLFNPQILFGLGTKFVLSENVNAFIEVPIRKLFTDYLDDVGNTYPDRNVMLNQAPDPNTTLSLTYRGDELDPNAAYPPTYIRRGGSAKDLFYSFNIGLSFRLNNVSFGGGSRRGSNKVRKVGSVRSRLKNPGSVF